MTGFAFWSLVVIASFGAVGAVAILAWAKPKSPGGTVANLAFSVWTLIALFVWLKP